MRRNPSPDRRRRGNADGSLAADAIAAWHRRLRSTRSSGKEPIEAWVNGPVIRELYDRHRGQFSLSAWPSGDPDALSAYQRALVEEILGTYGEQSADWWR